MSTLRNLIRADKDNLLQKVARNYVNGQVTVEYKATSDTQVGNPCLKKVYNYSGYDLIGSIIQETEWTTELEEKANPPITDISLSSLETLHSLPAGTKVADITVTGGVAPIDLQLTANPGGQFEIVGTELRLAIPGDSSASPYNITIEASDEAGHVYSEGFAVIVNQFNQTATRFDGVDSYVNCGNSGDFNGSSPFSISVWVKSSFINFQHVLYKDGTTVGKGWFLQLQNNGKIRFRIGASGAAEARIDSTATTLLDGTWHHVVVTYDGAGTASGLKLYVDGVEGHTVVADALAGNATDNLNSMLMGRWGGSGLFLNGYLDEISMWDKELTQAEVTELYNSGVPDDLANHSAAANRIHWWRMGDLDTHPLIIDHVGNKDGDMTNMGPSDFVTDIPGGA